MLSSAGARASCCSSSGVGGVGRLLAHERAMVEMASATRYVVGTFDNRGQFSSGHIKHLPHLVFEQELNIMTRLIDFFEPFVKIPTRVQISEIRTGTSLADITIGARMAVLKENFVNGFPSVTFIHQTRVPSGTSFSSGIQSEQVTSTGLWLHSFGLLLEKNLASMTLGLGYSLALPVNYSKARRVKDGMTHTPLAAVSFTPHETGFLSISTSASLQSSSSIDDKIFDDSDRRKFTIAASYALTMHSHIKLNAQAGFDVPITALGKNFNNEIFLRLGLRFGVF